VGGGRWGFIAERRLIGVRERQKRHERKPALNSPGRPPGVTRRRSPPECEGKEKGVKRHSGGESKKPFKSEGGKVFAPGVRREMSERNKKKG